MINPTQLFPQPQFLIRLHEEVSKSSKLGVRTPKSLKNRKTQIQLASWTNPDGQVSCWMNQTSRGREKKRKLRKRDKEKMRKDIKGELCRTQRLEDEASHSEAAERPRVQGPHEQGPGSLCFPWECRETQGPSGGGAAEGCDIEAVSKACWGRDRHPRTVSSAGPRQRAALLRISHHV